MSLVVSEKEGRQNISQRKTLVLRSTSRAFSNIQATSSLKVRPLALLSALYYSALFIILIKLFSHTTPNLHFLFSLSHMV